MCAVSSARGCLFGLVGDRPRSMSLGGGGGGRGLKV